jgi:hypothetical protein
MKFKKINKDELDHLVEFVPELNSDYIIDDIDEEHRFVLDQNAEIITEIMFDGYTREFHCDSFISGIFKGTSSEGNKIEHHIDVEEEA